NTDTNTKAGRLNVVRGIFKAYNCTTTGCHAPGGALTAVGAIDDDAWLNMEYVDPDAPETSYIYTKINHEGCSGECNMPSSSVKVTADEMAKIADWIARINEADPE